MQANKQERFRQPLREARSRVVAQTQHLTSSLEETAAATSQGSAAPVHLADFAADSLDADAHLLANERDLLDQIDAALARLDEGTFGVCLRCGKQISAQRLEAIPYASHCTACADQGAELSGDDIEKSF